MPSYRYCRSDDIPLLVQAYNECYRVHFPDLPRMSVERFKGLLRRIDLWTSSCMVALTGDEPIAVLLATKREDETLIHTIGVRPGHRRQGHARHLLRSLSSKLAILGPPRMVAEVPGNLDAARSLLEAAGFREERLYTDFLLRSPAESGEPSPPTNESRPGCCSRSSRRRRHSACWPSTVRMPGARGSGSNCCVRAVSKPRGRRWAMRPSRLPADPLRWTGRAGRMIGPR